MASSYKLAKTKATLLRTHELLHPQRAEIRELRESGVADRRVLALYPLDFAAYDPMLKAAYSNPGALKVALRLENMHRVLLRESQALSKALTSGAEQAWDELCETKALTPVLHVISLLNVQPASPQHPLLSPQNLLLRKAHVMLMNMHNLLWHIENWPGTRLPANTPSGAQEHFFEQLLATLETKYLTPMLDNIEGALAAGRYP